MNSIVVFSVYIPNFCLLILSRNLRVLLNFCMKCIEHLFAKVKAIYSVTCHAIHYSNKENELQICFRSFSYIFNIHEFFILL